MDSMNPTPWYKGKTLWVVVVIVVVLVGLYMLMGGSSSNNAPSNTNTNTTGQNTQQTDATPQAGEVAVDGRFNCLPLKGGKTPTADNCVLGIQGDDGKFYALDTSKIQSTDPNISAQGKVHAVGTLTPASSNAEAGNLMYDGVLAVRVMQAR